MIVCFKYELGQTVYIIWFDEPVECSVIGRRFEETICRDDEHRPKHVSEIKYTLTHAGPGAFKLDAKEKSIFKSRYDVGAFLLSKSETV